MDESLNRSSQNTGVPNESSSAEKQNPPKKPVEDICIDLTLDSDEEVDSASKNNQIIRNNPTNSNHVNSIPNQTHGINNRITARTNSQSSTNSNLSNGLFNGDLQRAIPAFNKNLLDEFTINNSNLNNVNSTTTSNDLIRFELTNFFLLNNFLSNSNDNVNNYGNCDDSNESCIVLD